MSKKTVLFCLTLGLLTAGAAGAAPARAAKEAEAAKAVKTAAVSFPKISGWTGRPVVIYENKKEAVLKKDGLLKLPFAVVTANGDEFDFSLNTFDRIHVYPKSKLQILEISDEAAFVPELYLLDGKLRVRPGYRGVEEAEVLVLKTPFFDLPLRATADFLVELDMKTPAVEVRVLEGVLPLEFFAFEKKLTLKAGESARFTGELAENGAGIRYDYLLNNRKVPKGRLSEVAKFDVTSFKNAENALADKAREGERNRLRKAAAQKKKQKAFEASFLCKKPFGQKDDCAWWAENGKCFRQRCNVNGEWGEVTERPMTAICGKDYYITQCDY